MVTLKMVLGETGCGCIIVSGNGPFSSSMNSAFFVWWSQDTQPGDHEWSTSVSECCLHHSHWSREVKRQLKCTKEWISQNKIKPLSNKILPLQSRKKWKMGLESVNTQAEADMKRYYIEELEISFKVEGLCAAGEFIEQPAPNELLLVWIAALLTEVFV